MGSGLGTIGDLSLFRAAATESPTAPLSNNATDSAAWRFCRTKLKLSYQIDSDAALLPSLIHQLGSAHEWSGV